MRPGHEPGRATCLVVNCSDDEQPGTQLHRLCRGKFQPQQNVRECAPERKIISNKHPHVKLLNILQHVNWHMET